MDHIEGTFRTVYIPLREMAIYSHAHSSRHCFQSTNNCTFIHTIYTHVTLQEAEIIVLNSNSYFCDACDVHVTVINKILSAVPLLV